MLVYPVPTAVTQARIQLVADQLWGLELVEITRR